jgi:hypothetical protein
MEKYHEGQTIAGQTGDNYLGYCGMTISSGRPTNANNLVVGGIDLWRKYRVPFRLAWRERAILRPC